MPPESFGKTHPYVRGQRDAYYILWQRLLCMGNEQKIVSNPAKQENTFLVPLSFIFSDWMCFYRGQVDSACQSPVISSSTGVLRKFAVYGMKEQ